MYEQDLALILWTLIQINLFSNIITVLYKCIHGVLVGKQEQRFIIHR